MTKTLDDWLRIMSPEFHGLASALWDLGARRFAKFPVWRYDEWSGPNAGKAAGPARPLLCPEPPPSGTNFELAWDLGMGWVMRSPLETVRQPHPIDQARFTLQSALATIAKISESNGQTLPRLMICGVEASERWLTAAMENGDPDTAALAFQAAVTYLFTVVMPGFLPTLQQGERMMGKTPASPIWSDIIAAALARHGHQIAPSRLLALLGGRKEYDEHKRLLPLRFGVADDPRSAGSPTESADTSEVGLPVTDPLCALPSIEWGEFERLVRQAKRSCAWKKWCDT